MHVQQVRPLIITNVGLVDRCAQCGARLQSVCSAIDDRLGKPHPAIFLRTAEALGVDPIECVVLEDSLNGCIAAKAARMRVISVPDPRFAEDSRFGIADVRLSSLVEIGGGEVADLLGIRRLGS